MTVYLLDTNILLRVVQPASPQHTPAVDALATLISQEHTVAITPQNLIEFWSVASRPAEANGLGWPVATARQEIDRLLVQFPLLDDQPMVFTHWRTLVTSYQIIGRRIHDARLVAVMLSHGVSHLLTFNSDDFRQFSEIVVVEPSEVAAAGGAPGAP